MTGSVVASLSLFMCLALFSPSVLAQKIVAPIKNRIPFARVGLFFGRTGIAQGPGAYVEINPLLWVGICAIVSHSHTTHDVEEGHARVSDLLSGGCVTGHLPEMKGILISPFVQIALQSEHDRVLVPLGDGTFYHDGEDSKHRIWTVGSTIDRAIVKGGPRWIARVGRNFGDSPAANNGGGLYFVGGLIFPLDHPAELGRSLAKMFGRKPEPADAAEVQP